MKILYHHRTRSRDGQAVHIEEMIGALRNLGCEVIVVEPPATAGARFDGGSGSVGLVRRFLPRALSELLELAYSAVAYRRLRRAYLLHRPDIIYERHNLFLLAGALVRRKYGVPYLLEVNSPLCLERIQHGGLALARFARWTERFAWGQADAVLAVTGVLGEIIAAEGVARDRVVVVPNGINPAHFAHAPEPGKAKADLGISGRMVLGFTGFVREWHGLDRVIDFIAAARRPELLLLVVGDGTARAELEAQATRLGVTEQVRFTGVVSRDKLPAHVAAFDIALQPAATPYASPLKLFEYLALGKAIIAPAQANLVEILEHDRNALLFAPTDREDFFRALATLVDDGALRERLGRDARDTIDRRGLTWARNAERAIAIGQRLRDQAIGDPSIHQTGRSAKGRSQVADPANPPIAAPLDSAPLGGDSGTDVSTSRRTMSCVTTTATRR
jgi:glycosyltransferase involved in cell wall biosynthesis